MNTKSQKIDTDQRPYDNILRSCQGGSRTGKESWN